MASGDYDRVNLHSRSPYRHHHYDHENSDKVVGAGDDDRVRVHSKRNPQSTLLMDKNRTILVTSMVRRGSHHSQGHGGKDELIVGGDHGYVETHMRRESSSADGTPDVPGVVDVMVSIVQLDHLTR